MISCQIRCSAKLKIAWTFSASWCSTSGLGTQIPASRSSFARAKDWTPLRGEAPARAGFFAQMIDHGFAFNGPHWEFQDSPLQGVYFRPSVYSEVTSLDSFQPWLDMVRHFPVEVIDEAWKQIPRSWLDGDEGELERLLERLLKRRNGVERLIEDVRRHRAAMFANWR